VLLSIVKSTVAKTCISSSSSRRSRSRAAQEATTTATTAVMDEGDDEEDDDDEEDSFASPLDAAAINDTIGSVFVCGGAGGVGSSSCCSEGGDDSRGSWVSTASSCSGSSSDYGARVGVRSRGGGGELADVLRSCSPLAATAAHPSPAAAAAARQRQPTNGSDKY